jgi:hypothetical protein
VTKANDENSTARWRGDEVQDQPGDAAERAADRAEGNAPVRADEQSKRQRELSDSEPADPETLPTALDGDDTSAQDKIAEAAEEHRERHPASERPPRGKL